VTAAFTFDAGRRLVASYRGPAFGALGSYRLSASTGAITATLAASSPLFSFRWSDSTNLCILEEIAVSAVIASDITTAVATGLEAIIARSFTGSDSGGAAITLSGNSMKKRTSYGTTLLGDARIAGTGTLTAGTRTLDANGVGSAMFGTGTSRGTTALARTVLYKYQAGSVDPIIFAQDEGFIVRNTQNGPANGTFRVGVDVSWIETAVYVP